MSRHLTASQQRLLQVLALAVVVCVLVGLSVGVPQPSAPLAASATVPTTSAPPATTTVPSNTARSLRATTPQATAVDAVAPAPEDADAAAPTGKSCYLGSGPRQLGDQRVHAAPLVSVITSVLNPDCDILRVTAQSLCDLSIPVHWMVVNDHSTQPLCPLVYELGATVVCNEGTPGLGPARQVAVDMVTTPYWILLDGDDWLKPLSLEKAVWYLETHNAASMTSFLLQEFGWSHGTWITGFFRVQYIWHNNVIPVSTLVRTSDIQLCGARFRDMRGGLEDWDFWLQLVDCGLTGHSIPSLDFMYRTRDPAIRAKQWPSNFQKGFQDTIRARYPRLKDPNAVPRWDYGKPFLSNPGARVVAHPPRHLTLSAAAAFIARRDQSADRHCSVLLVHPMSELGGVQTFELSMIEQLHASTPRCHVVVAMYTPPEVEQTAYTDAADEVFIVPTFVDVGDTRAFFEHLLTSRDINYVVSNDNPIGSLLLPQLRRQFPLVTFAALVHSFNQADITESATSRATDAVDAAPWLDVIIACHDELAQFIVGHGAPASRVRTAHIGCHVPSDSRVQLLHAKSPFTPTTPASPAAASDFHVWVGSLAPQAELVPHVVAAAPTLQAAFHARQPGRRLVLHIAGGDDVKAAVASSSSGGGAATGTGVRGSSGGTTATVAAATAPVALVDVVDPDAAMLYLCSSDVLLLLSPSLHSASSVTQVTATACGVAIVGAASIFAQAPQPLVHKHSALLCRDDNTACLAQAVVSLAVSPVIARGLAARARSGKGFSAEAGALIGHTGAMPQFVELVLSTAPRCGAGSAMDVATASTECPPPDPPVGIHTAVRALAQRAGAASVDMAVIFQDFERHAVLFAPPGGLRAWTTHAMLGGPLLALLCLLVVVRLAYPRLCRRSNKYGRPLQSSMWSRCCRRGARSRRVPV